ncbi:MAG: trypsin-like peptidase domain-containing protein [Gemmatimonadota bacterium]|nr:trypsin-like peptidase domain-containing protein [Gemmatimonadota bacterium]
MKDPLRAKLTVIGVAIVAFAFGLGMASALDLTPVSLAAGDGPEIVEGAPWADEVDVPSGFADVVDRITPAVVTVEVAQEVQTAQGRALPAPFEDFFGPFGGPDDGEPQYRGGSGSGFIISADGYIVTNNHVVENATEVTVELADRRRFDNVEVVGTDPTTDVALLKISAGSLPVAPLGVSDSVRVGDWSLAIGSPGFAGTGTLSSTVTAGIVSAKGRNIGILSQRYVRRGMASPAIEDFIQTDAAINPGNSGGPLVNARGEVIGMNTAIMSRTGFYQGYGFAVPIELVREVVDDLVEYGEVRRAIIGVSIEGVTAADARYFDLREVAGAKVVDVGIAGEEESPAAEAGIRPGDLILAVDGDRIQSVGDLQRKIRTYEPGETVTLTIMRRETRERDRVDVTLTSADTPEPDRREMVASEEPGANPLGIEVQPVTEELRRRMRAEDLQPPEEGGVFIRDVEPRGALGRVVDPRFARGLILLDVNGREIRGAEDYREAMAEVRPGEVVSLLFLDPQSGRNRVFNVPIPAQR